MRFLSEKTAQRGEAPTYYMVEHKRCRTSENYKGKERRNRTQTERRNMELRFGTKRAMKYGNSLIKLNPLAKFKNKIFMTHIPH